MNNIDLLITLTQEKNDENNVTIAFTMGLKALEKGYSVEMILLSNAVALGKKEITKIDIGAPFKGLEELIPAYFENGGVLKVCKACMAHNGVKEEELDKRAIVIQADDVIDSLMGAKKSLQLN